MSNLSSIFGSKPSSKGALTNSLKSKSYGAFAGENSDESTFSTGSSTHFSQLTDGPSTKPKAEVYRSKDGNSFEDKTEAFINNYAQQLCTVLTHSSPYILTNDGLSHVFSINLNTMCDELLKQTTVNNKYLVVVEKVQDKILKLVKKQSISKNHAAYFEIINVNFEKIKKVELIKA